MIYIVFNNKNFLHSIFICKFARIKLYVRHLTAVVARLLTYGPKETLFTKINHNNK